MFDAAKGIASVEYAKSMGAKPPLSLRLRVTYAVDTFAALVSATTLGQHSAARPRPCPKTTGGRALHLDACG